MSHQCTRDACRVPSQKGIGRNAWRLLLLGLGRARFLRRFPMVERKGKPMMIPPLAIFATAFVRAAAAATTTR